MKAKVKLDVAAIKRWLFDHGEKVAFSCVVLVFIMFTWSAMKREVLDGSKQPDNLRQKSQAVKTKVEQSEWDAKREGLAVVDYASRAKREPLAVATYKLPTPLSVPLADPKAKRDDPAILAAEEIRAAAGFSMFSVRAPGAGNSGSSTSTAQPWAVVTAIVPVKKQAQEYARVFERAMGESGGRDEPSYAGYIIERAEVNESQPDKLEWKALPGDKFAEQWAGTGSPDIVAQDYLDPAFTNRLGPLVGGSQWDETVAHPKIPLATAAARAKAAAAAAEAEKNKNVEQAESADAAPAENARLVRRPKADAKTPAPVAAAQTVEPVDIVYKLLRVFDFTVEPAKKYRYRVTLAMDDPNFGLAKHMLKNPEKEHKDIVESPSSEPTGVVTIPTGSRVLAAGVAKGTRNDPAAKIMVSRIDREQGIEPAGEMDVWRGSVANFSADKLPVVNPAGGTKELTDVEIKSGVLVLDVRGGRPLSNKRDAATSPIELLILDPQGNLSVRNELDDLSVVEYLKPRDEPKRAKESEAPENDGAKARPKTKKGR